MMGRAVIGGRERPDRTASRSRTQRGARDMLEADLAVAADGLWSRLRAAARTGGRRNTGALPPGAPRSPRADAPASLAGDETGLWLGRDGHVVHYPIAGGRLLNIVAVERRAAPVEGWAAPGDRAELLAAFAAAAPPLRALLAAAPAWQLWSLFDLPAAPCAAAGSRFSAMPPIRCCPSWRRAARSPSRMRRCSPARSPERTDVAAALAAYERARLPRARRIQQAARRNGAAYHAGGVKAFIRDAVIRHLGPEAHGAALRLALRLASGVTEGRRRSPTAKATSTSFPTLWRR